MDKKICKNCKWFEYLKDDDKSGICHRFPPTIMKGEQYDYSCFPKVKEDDFCGEFENRNGDSLKCICHPDWNLGIHRTPIDCITISRKEYKKKYGKLNKITKNIWTKK